MSAWLSLEDAIINASSHIYPITQRLLIPLSEANGRILAESIISPLNVPPWDNSAMDGYAVRWSDHKTKTVTQTIKAGELSSQTVLLRECARVMTGAPIPPGADTVVMQENVKRTQDTIEFIVTPKKGDNIRPKAGDIAQGDELFKTGHRVVPQDMMLLASIGLTHVTVVRKPKVAVVATGDELALPGSARSDKQIYESYRTGLTAKLLELGCEVTDAGIVKDDQNTITEIFKTLSQTHDMVISSGGVSVGDADWVKPALSSLGTLHLWKIAIKPGKPFAFGQFGSCYFCGLPGNPVSAFVTFDQIVTPLLKKLKGHTEKFSTLMLRAQLTTPVKRRSGRKEFARGVFSTDTEGNLSVSVLAKQSSSVMTSLTNANCYVVIDAHSESLNSGEWVHIQPFSI